MTPGEAAGITVNGQDADPARHAVPEKARTGRIRRGAGLAGAAVRSSSFARTAYRSRLRGGSRSLRTGSPSSPPGQHRHRPPARLFPGEPRERNPLIRSSRRPARRSAGLSRCPCRAEPLAGDRRRAHAGERVAESSPSDRPRSLTRISGSLTRRGASCRRSRTGRTGSCPRRGPSCRGPGARCRRAGSRRLARFHRAGLGQVEYVLVAEVDVPIRADRLKVPGGKAALRHRYRLYPVYDVLDGKELLDLAQYPERQVGRPRGVADVEEERAVHYPVHEGAPPFDPGQVFALRAAVIVRRVFFAQVVRRGRDHYLGG